MNIDLLEDNPAWWTYLCVAAPMAVLILLAFLGLKYKLILRKYVAKLGKCLGHRRSRRGPHGDEENQTHADMAPSMLNYFEAAALGHTLMVINSISSGIRITAVEPSTRGTALHFAAGNGRGATVRTLVTELGAHVEAKDNEGRTALHVAAKCEHEATVRTLVTEFGADVEAKDNEGRTALHLASHGAMIRLLVTVLGADIEAKDNMGMTPLHIAALPNPWYSVPQVRALLALNANKEATTKDGNTPLDLSRKGGHVETAHALGGRID